MMGEAVQQRGDGGGIGEDGVPVFKSFVRGDENGAAFITAADEFKEQIGGIRIIGQICEFIDAEQRWTGIVLQTASKPLRGIAMQIGKDLGSGPEKDGMSGLNGGVSDILNNH